MKTFRSRVALVAAVVGMLAPAASGRAADPSGGLHATLPNGLRVVIVPDRLAPVVTTQLNYMVGSNDAPEGFPGTAHALEHMMFRGSAGLDRDQLAELGARLGGVYNASTTETVTQYTYTVDADDLPVALRSEALRMRGLTLDESDWTQERGAIDQEVSRDLSSPIYTYMSQLQGILFEGTPYEHDALGTRASFARTDAALLRRFYDQWYAPNNAILVIAGNVDPDRALTEVETAFGGIPRRDIPGHAAITPRPVQPKTIALPTDFPVGLVSIAYRMPGLRSADFAAADILGDVLGSRRGALYGLVPGGQALLSQFSYRAKADVGFGLALAAFPKGDDPAPLMDAVRRIIAETVRDGVPADLVAAAKRQELAQIGFQNDSISGLATTWSQAVAGAGVDGPEDIARAYAAVTVMDVNRLARTLLDPDHAITAVLTPRGEGQVAASGGFGGGESFSSPPDHPVALPAWATDALMAVHQPPPPTPPVVSMLPNGLRLIVQPEHVSHTISVYGRVREVTETQEAPGKEGVAQVMRSLFGYGTTTLDRLGFQTALDDIGATAATGPGFALRVLTPEFEHGMQLLADGELHPAFPAAALPVVRNQLARSLAGQQGSPDYLFSRAVVHAMVPDNDPALREATPASVAALQLADVADYYARVFRPDRTTIVVIGDVTPEEAGRVVAQTFGAWQAPDPAAGQAPDIELPPVASNPVSRTRIVAADTLQDRVSLIQTVGLPVGSPERYTLLLGNVILGSGFSSRLYRDLRVRTGYVYTVSSALDWSRTRGDYSVSFGADAENVARARQLVVNDIRDMQTVPVGDAELTRAKAQVLRRLSMQRASVGAIAAQYLRSAELDLPIDPEQVTAQRYLNITATDIQKAFATWLRPDDLAEVVKGPATPK